VRRAERLRTLAVVAWAQKVVAPARRSPGAGAKASRKRNGEGLPVHSFQSLLADLSTIARNRVRSIDPSGESSAVEFDLLTTPTPLQRKAFELLGVPLSL